MAKTLYHRLAEQISAYAKEVQPDFVQEIAARIGDLDTVKAPQTHMQRMAQSDRGHQNPGTGKKKR